jgi:ABC-type multidrug transport system permease subunit
MPVWTLIKKELRLLLRDRMAAGLLLGMPLIFILVLGLLLGEGFGQKADDRLRFSLVDLDQGLLPVVGAGFVGLGAAPGGTGPLLGASALLAEKSLFPGEPWSRVVQRDLAETANIKVEVIGSAPEAERLIREHKRAAVLIFQPSFSVRVNRCSFLVDGINPFHRDGVWLDMVGVDLLRDEKQPGASAIIDQVAQVALLRVILPWMIGRAFERLSDKEFIELLGDKVRLPVPRGAEFLFAMRNIKLQDGKASLNEALRVAAPNERSLDEYRKKVGGGVQSSLSEQFRKYNLTGKNWAALTKSLAKEGPGAEVVAYQSQDGTGVLRRGAQRYQVLVPSYTVMFAFFLVLTVGWVFVAERRQGTLKRLQAAPLTRGQVLLGKLVPCFLVSLGQGVFLMIAGRLLFGMRWGPDRWPLAEQAGWLGLVVFCTSLAAMGLAFLVAALARTEIQVALYGAVPVLVLALIGGCVLPREMMPEQTQQLTLLTPQGWALDAYRELLDTNPLYDPNLTIILRACAVLAAFGAGFLATAWGLLRLD